MCVGSGWVHDRSPSKNSIMGCGNGRLFGKYSTFINKFIVVCKCYLDDPVEPNSAVLLR